MAYQVTYDANIGGLPIAPTLYSGLSVYSGYSITGTRSFLLTNLSYVYFPFITPTDTPAISVWVRNTGYSWTTNSNFRILFYTDDGQSIGLWWNIDRLTYDLYVNSSKVADGACRLEEISLHNIRIYGTIADSGSMYAKLNGVDLISYSGDTKPSTSNLIDRIYFYAYKTFSWNSCAVYLSSLSINDGGTDPGDRRAQVLMPDGDSSVQWTPSTGSDNYALVDEIPPSSSDYLETSTDGHKDLLTLADFTGTGRTITGVTKFVQAWKTTADDQSLKNGVKSGSTEDSTEEILSTSALYYHHGMGVNPDDSAAWEDGDIDGLLTLHEAVIP